MSPRSYASFTPLLVVAGALASAASAQPRCERTCPQAQRDGNGCCVARARITSAELRGAAVDAAASALVYRADFEDSHAALDEWSLRTVGSTPTRARRFLGPFANETATLVLNDLPPHAGIAIEFDVYVMQSWDGSGNIGPDVWEVNVVNTGHSMRTTFCNPIPRHPSHQSYPGRHPGPAMQCQSGARETSTLGYMWGHDRADAVYHLTLALAHSERAIAVNFLASGLEDVTNESWGIDNVVVRATASAP